ncbi:Por secretion system C-terminal sorting domain-containing protein [Formosa sp. Hel1_31_208]|uniref:T9SS type A sorting domain-containing protein n=1 Tax=Formosa sp. Hel1_31_208 TaxID=1798225 RepID=UPI00087BC4B1|nr:T9SS type A sorting domain-containing protein [Formosa sp. Hel1_31_208]SDS65863.1 Por secretion system C-terminal sorting domain-containing protein [Formosa sp. Hel1_31_208]
MKKTTIFKVLTKLQTAVLLVCLLLSTGHLFASNETAATTTTTTIEEPDLRMKIRLEYNSPNSYMREISVLADENASSGFDEDFDTEMDNIQSDDMFWLIDSGKFLNQGINDINEDTVIPIGITTNSNGINTIEIDKLENIPNSMNIFVHDITLGIYFNIKEGPYAVNLNSGVYLNRFEIVFAQPDTLGVNEFETNANSIDIRFDVNADQIKVLNNANINIHNIEIYSILGQSVYRSNAINSNNTFTINADQMTTGAYIVIVHTENGIDSKKILVN